MDLGNKRVLITGAGSGIGRQLAFSCAQRGAALWLTDIDAAGLERSALLCRKLGARVAARVVDVADTTRMSALADEVHAEGGALDLLVNNAGVGVAGLLLETDPAVWDWAYGINVKGVAHGCRFFAPAMVARGNGGHIVNVASAAGLVAPPRMAVYAATKFAVIGLSESLRNELLEHGVRVSAVCPGVVDTPITRNSRLTGSLSERAGFQDEVADIYRRRNYGPERVAEVVLRAVERGHSGILPVTPESWLLYLGNRLAPGLIADVQRRSALM